MEVDESTRDHVSKSPLGMRPQSLEAKGKAISIDHVDQYAPLEDHLCMNGHVETAAPLDGLLDNHVENNSAQRRSMRAKKENPWYKDFVKS